MDPETTVKSVIVAALFLGVVTCAALVSNPASTINPSQGGTGWWSGGESDDD